MDSCQIIEGFFLNAFFHDAMTLSFRYFIIIWIEKLVYRRHSLSSALLQLYLSINWVDMIWLSCSLVFLRWFGAWRRLDIIDWIRSSIQRLVWRSWICVSDSVDWLLFCIVWKSYIWIRIIYPSNSFSSSYALQHITSQYAKLCAWCSCIFHHKSSII